MVTPVGDSWLSSFDENGDGDGVEEISEDVSSDGEDEIEFDRFDNEKWLNVGNGVLSDSPMYWKSNRKCGFFLYKGKGDLLVGISDAIS